ncbi:MAG: hemerythrin domain-containing protein [Acidimicrobiales bacterium]
MPDPFRLLRQDHRRIEQLFSDYLTAGAPGYLARQLCDLLVAHDAVENEVLYPAFAAEVAGGAQLAEEMREDHDEMAESLGLIEELGHDEPEVEGLMRAIMFVQKDHVADEESLIFQRCKMDMTHARLDALGQRVDEVYRRVNELGPDERPAIAAAPPARGLGPARLAGMSKAELYELAAQRSIAGRSSMTKDQLLAALKKR